MGCYVNRLLFSEVYKIFVYPLSKPSLEGEFPSYPQTKYVCRNGRAVLCLYVYSDGSLTWSGVGGSSVVQYLAFCLPLLQSHFFTIIGAVYHNNGKSGTSVWCAQYTSRIYSTPLKMTMKGVPEDLFK